MAAKTPTVYPLSFGNRIGLLAIFSDIDDGDTWATGLPAEPVHKSIDNKTDGVVVSAAYSAGTYTFTVASAGSNKSVTMLLLK